MVVMELRDVGFDNLIADAEFAGAAQQVFFMEVIAIGAIEIAEGSGGLDHGVESRLGAGIDRKRGQESVK
jgi:hypothetical protein